MVALSRFAEGHDLENGDNIVRDYGIRWVLRWKPIRPDHTHSLSKKRSDGARLKMAGTLVSSPNLVSMDSGYAVSDQEPSEHALALGLSKLGQWVLSDGKEYNRWTAPRDNGAVIDFASRYPPHWPFTNREASFQKRLSIGRSRPNHPVHIAGNTIAAIVSL
jgi:hypothetical protein